ncbi:hypothetical protein [Tranquillimonas alkanivorans]|uniref:Uncharacterized protein n=1 Tax=Tranquillimonas alkanivorans TaxID=441119 RepID=A0A1I5PBR6_9RHOB|nr:hypothetical protein [Tranquillimonas alkanivorans]SFP31564.1 hypothetical protein SAMN04488047_10525 [Tranquillimonas alkanivorans]
MSAEKRGRSTGRLPTEEARRRGLRNSLAKRAAAPRCGAKRRTDGEPCTQPVPEAGKRCRYHGGATPKGKEWHRRQWPRKGAAPSRLKGKMLALAVRDRKAEERRAAMTPEELEAHEKHRRAVRPGTPSQRQQARRAREARQLVEELDRKREGPPTGEQAALAAQIAELEAKAERLRAEETERRTEGTKR